ncbi:MAG TPA: hypothetical protein VJ998_09195, partial [Pseudomonadales bacterium]|nr:hypothetical protein [Pseudomonadales bacterium]
MQRFGFVLFVAGVVVSSWYAARYVPDDKIPASGPNGTITAMDRLDAWGSVAGWPFAGGAVLMIGGGIVARRAMGKAVRASSTAESTTPDTDTRAMLAGIETAVAGLHTADPQTHAVQLREELDAIIDDLIPDFLEQQGRHVAHLGLGTFIEMNSEFASA